MTEFPALVAQILLALERAGYEARCVGGCVRDLLLGRAPEDWDVATAARPEEVMALFGPEARPTGLRHGTVTVCRGGGRVEVTTYRRDGVYADHRHPETVAFTPSLAEDLRRRDFTVNAMALDRFGRLTDLAGGEADLRARVLRCVGRPDDRFGEDALRILRCLRFASVLGFSVEEETAAALREKKGLLADIAAERVNTELTKLLCGSSAEKIMLTYPDVLGAVLPEILPSVGFDQRNPHHCYDVWEHTARALAEVPPEPALRWVMLLHDLGKPEVCVYDSAAEKARYRGHQEASCRLAEPLLSRLRFPAAEKERILRLIRYHDLLFEPTERSMRRLLARFGEKDARALIAIRRADNLAQAAAYHGLQAELAACETVLETMLRQRQCFSLRELAVDGTDLTALGLRGPEVGETLRRLLLSVVDGAMENDRAALLAEAKRLAGGGKEK